jgi:hypothetical protein
MSKYNKGEIYFANVRFDEGIGAKIRPVLVVEHDGVKVSAYKMTSHAPRDEVATPPSARRVPPPRYRPRNMKHTEAYSRR